MDMRILSGTEGHDPHGLRTDSAVIHAIRQRPPDATMPIAADS